MVEVLIAVSRDPFLPYEMVLAWLETSGSSEEENEEVPLNRGNSVRNQRIYLHSWTKAKCGHFMKKDYYVLSERGHKKARYEGKRLGRYLRAIDWKKMSMDIKTLMQDDPEEKT